jgi:predicted nuclease of predicted toxin-antitoxin system
MRVLADENIDRPIVHWLRERGHDVEEATVAAPEAPDAQLIDRSRRQDRILMTFDRDIGRIIRADPLPHPGVIYLRLRGAGPDLWNAFKRIWPSIEPVAPHHFVTVRNHQVRRRPLPMEKRS